MTEASQADNPLLSPTTPGAMSPLPSLLAQIDSPEALRLLPESSLAWVASELRAYLIQTIGEAGGHFAANLGTVELTLALHYLFDTPRDRLVWDVGHQTYPHKILTGRRAALPTIRKLHGLAPFPQRAESPFDSFGVGHSSTSISAGLGMALAARARGERRRVAAIIGDGAMTAGMAYEALNHAGHLRADLLVILNDNEMGICPRVGGLAKCLDKARVAPFYNGLKRDVNWLLNKVPVVGQPSRQAIGQIKDAIKGFLHGGMLFEELGFRYIGPVDGHDLASLRGYLEMVKEVTGPVLLHVFTQKGHGFDPACEDPVMFHAPPPFQRRSRHEVLSVKKSSSRAYTNSVSDAIYESMQRDSKVCVLTAAMCEGNKLGRVRQDFPDRFFDTGICEAHTVAFAAGMAKSGLRPIVNIYSTFLQRSFDHIFQEVALQNLPVTFCLDRGGLAGPDGPTHHGVFDNSYMRVFPNMTVMAPGDEFDVAPMLEFALSHGGPVSIRYPKANIENVEREECAVDLGKAEVWKWGRDGMFVAFGALFPTCVQAAERLRSKGLDVGVINARFAKPLDQTTIFRALEESEFVIAVEENTVCGGFGSAVLEAANAAGVSTNNLKCLGIPDRFVEHGERDELLAELGLDTDGLVATAMILRDRGPCVRQLPSKRLRASAG